MQCQLARKIAGDRIAYKNSTALYVKEGLTGSWVNVAGAAYVNEWQLTSNRVARREGSWLYIKAGLTDSWTALSNTASDTNWKIAESGRVANKDSNALWVIQWPSAGGFVNVAAASYAQQWDLT